ncbi:unnamed protein product [Protopolystoma xenopodis]|uniref:Uncharacterized protein n=1 Tax=Protopolystoma xenopodis TaxID=117903 RepID=A0A3S5CEV5_9PLAT|nr:unnamed protein product [Protopolystoma xenopodis]
MLLEKDKPSMQKSDKKAKRSLNLSASSDLSPSKLVNSKKRKNRDSSSTGGHSSIKKAKIQPVKFESDCQQDSDFEGAQSVCASPDRSTTSSCLLLTNLVGAINEKELRDFFKDLPIDYISRVYSPLVCITVKSKDLSKKVIETCREKMFSNRRLGAIEVSGDVEALFSSPSLPTVRVTNIPHKYDAVSSSTPVGSSTITLSGLPEVSEHEIKLLFPSAESLSLFVTKGGQRKCFVKFKDSKTRDSELIRCANLEISGTKVCSFQYIIVVGPANTLAFTDSRANQESFTKPGLIAGDKKSQNHLAKDGHYRFANSSQNIKRSNKIESGLSKDEDVSEDEDEDNTKPPTGIDADEQDEESDEQGDDDESDFEKEDEDEDELESDQDQENLSIKHQPMGLGELVDHLEETEVELIHADMVSGVHVVVILVMIVEVGPGETSVEGHLGPEEGRIALFVGATVIVSNVAVLGEIVDSRILCTFLIFK